MKNTTAMEPEELEALVRLFDIAQALHEYVPMAPAVYKDLTDTIAHARSIWPQVLR